MNLNRMKSWELSQSFYTETERGTSFSLLYFLVVPLQSSKLETTEYQHLILDLLVKGEDYAVV